MDSLLIALANNVDNVSVRIAYSMKGIKMGTKCNLWISVITLVISAAACLLGNSISHVISPVVSKLISMVILTALGVWFIIEPHLSAHNKNENSSYSEILINPASPDIDNSKTIDFKEATFLGLALSVNNIGGSVGAGMIGLNAFVIGFLSAAISFCALLAGDVLTKYIMKLSMLKYTATASGIVLIAIGIKQLL